MWFPGFENGDKLFLLNVNYTLIPFQHILAHNLRTTLSEKFQNFIIYLILY